MGTVVTVVCKLHLVLLHALPGGLNWSAEVELI